MVQIIGGGGGNDETMSMLMGLLQHQDRLAMAREEMEQRKRQAMLDRAQQVTNREVEAKLQSDEAKRKEDVAKQLGRISNARAAAKEFRNLDDFNAALPEMKGAGLSETEIETARNNAVLEQTRFAQAIGMLEGTEYGKAVAREAQVRELLSGNTPGGFQTMPMESELKQQGIENVRAEEAFEAQLARDKIEERRVDAYEQSVEIQRAQNARNAKASELEVLSGVGRIFSAAADTQMTLEQARQKRRNEIITADVGALPPVVDKNGKELSESELVEYYLHADDVMFNAQLRQLAGNAQIDAKSYAQAVGATYGIDLSEQLKIYLGDPSTSLTKEQRKNVERMIKKFKLEEGQHSFLPLQDAVPNRLQTFIKQTQERTQRSAKPGSGAVAAEAALKATMEELKANYQLRTQRRK